MQQFGQWFSVQTPLFQGLMVFAGCYLLGCLTLGYYLVRWCSGVDLREVGSGGVGAKNAGRVLGRSGFVVTLLGDILKGALAIWLTKQVVPAEWFATLAVVAVVAGHIWPVQLRFQGGKGIATTLGALLVYDWVMLLVWGGVMGACYLLFRRFVLAGLVAVVAVPIAAVVTRGALVDAAGLTLLVVIVWFAHRNNLREEFLIFSKHLPQTR
ncbi:MAG: glycerol-3-phosphate acyltransferase [Verrucomicrobiae bacterium]|nr:glycerol-3-phosphate acyltransferase [Verrucomicrobiae bacterium]